MILAYTLPGAKESILAGTKIHTLRTDKAKRWKPGYEIHHATGPRSPEYDCFLKNKCISTQDILLVLVRPDYVKATIDRNRMSDDQVKQLAINDGFANVDELIKWFFKKGHTLWAGKIIHWTRLKY